MNWVSRVPVIFFLGGGFRFDFLRPMAIGGQTCGEKGQKSEAHGRWQSSHLILRTGWEGALAVAHGKGRICTMVPKLLLQGAEVPNPRAERQFPHSALWMASNPGSPTYCVTPGRLLKFAVPWIHCL